MDFIELVQKRLSKLPEISEYNQTYLSRLMAEIQYRVKIYNNIITEVFKQCSIPKDKITLVDYGGGAGLLSCYAKWVGIGNVIYVDIFEQSVIDAKKIASALNLKADSYVLGNIESINKRPDVLISTDVIEHIYSLEYFFSAGYKLNPNLIQIHVTGANPYNPVIRKRLMKLQIRNENENHTPKKGAKSIDDYRAYREIRKEWIEKKFSDELSVQEINKITTLTRGKNFDDIELIINDYINNRKYPIPISHPTNTCDPNTGNWSERLISEQEMQEACNSFGWKCNYYSIGFNNQQKSFIKNTIWTLLNVVGKSWKSKSKHILPLLKIIIK